MNAKAWLLFASVLVYSSIGLLSLNSYQDHAEDMLALRQHKANDRLIPVEDAVYLADSSVDPDSTIPVTSVSDSEPLVGPELIARLTAESQRAQLRLLAAIEAQLAMEEAANIACKAIENSFKETIIDFESDQLLKAKISGPAKLASARTIDPATAAPILDFRSIDMLATFAADFARSAARTGTVVLPRQTAKIDRAIDNEEAAPAKSDFRMAGYRMKKSTRSRTALTIVPNLSANITAANFLTSYRIQAIESIQRAQDEIAGQLKLNQFNSIINAAKAKLQENWIIDSVKNIFFETPDEILLDINYQPHSTEFQSQVMQVGYVVVIPDSDNEAQTVLREKRQADSAAAPRIPKFDGRLSLVAERIRIPGTLPEPNVQDGADQRSNGRIFRLLRFRRK